MKRMGGLVSLVLIVGWSHLASANQVTAKVGDTISVDFAFTTPFVDPKPTLLGFGVKGTIANPAGPWGDANFALYDGGTLLNSHGAGYGGGFAGGWYSSDYPSLPCQSMWGCADFTTIRNQSIDGHIDATLTQGTLTFDATRPGVTSVYAGNSNRQPTYASILAVSVNNNEVYTRPEGFSGHTNIDAAFGCGKFVGIKLCPGYDYEFDGTSLTISLDIGLRGSPTTALKSTWENGIESLWGSERFGYRYSILDGPNEYPIYFDVNFVSGNSLKADFYVTVLDQIETKENRTDTRTWYTKLLDGKDQYQGVKVAHEFGHYLGLYDEYNGGTVGSFGWNCDQDFSLIAPENAKCDGLMGDLRRPTLARYYEEILANFADETQHSVSLARSPLMPPEQPYTDYLDPPDGPAAVSVPEPKTVWLILLGVFALYVRTAGVSRFRVRHR